MYHIHLENKKSRLIFLTAEGKCLKYIRIKVSFYIRFLNIFEREKKTAFLIFLIQLLQVESSFLYLYVQNFGDALTSPDHYLEPAQLMITQVIRRTSIPFCRPL